MKGDLSTIQQDKYYKRKTDATYWQVYTYTPEYTHMVVMIQSATAMLHDRAI